MNREELLNEVQKKIHFWLDQDLFSVKEMSMLLIDLIQRNAESKDEWVSVADRLPKMDCYYLVKGDMYPQICVRPFNTHHVCWDDEESDDYFTDAVGGRITHWQPLPQPPKQGSNHE